MNKHTPGPWKIATDWAGYPQHIRTECGSVACSFLTSVKRNCESEQIEANARLIAAAPDLLEALVNLRDFAVMSNKRQVEYLDAGNKHPAEVAQAAIAKAIGVQP